MKRSRANIAWVTAAAHQQIMYIADVDAMQLNAKLLNRYT